MSNDNSGDRLVPKSKTVHYEDIVKKYSGDNSSSMILSHDLDTIMKLKKDLVFLGVIDDEEAEEKTFDDLNELMSEATHHAQTEEDYAPDTYAENVNSLLDSEELNNKNNPMVDGLDDFGNKTHEGFVENGTDIKGNTENYMGENSGDEIVIKLPDGRIIVGRIV